MKELKHRSTKVFANSKWSLIYFTSRNGYLVIVCGELLVSGSHFSNILTGRNANTSPAPTRKNASDIAMAMSVGGLVSLIP